MASSSYLSRGNVIVGGDLNLTLNLRETLGEVVRKDPFGDYFSHLFKSLHLIYVESFKIVSTWRNVRKGKEGK
jgi:hypothetical protein